MVVYIDVLLVTNFLISYFLLIASAVLSGYTYNRKNIVLSALAGALFCLYIFADVNNKLVNFLFKFMSLAVCSAVAFGIKDKRKLIVQSLCCFLLNMLLTGAAILISIKSAVVYENNMFFYFSINPVMLVIFSAAIYLIVLLFEIVREKISPKKIYLMDIYFKDFSIRGLSAFYDSGFKIKDIVSNKDVVVVGFAKIKESVPVEMAEDICNFLNGRYNDVKDGYIPVFFNTLSGSGMIPAVKSEYLVVEDKIINNILVAFTENELSENVTAIFGTDIKGLL